MSAESRHDHERDFHDAWAESVPCEDIDVRAAFESPAAMENRFILSRMGDLKGRRILDIGAGLGESSVYFALCGAEVTMTDLSPGMVRKARELAQRYGVQIKGVVCPAEALAVEPGAFDIAYAANLLHHVADKDLFFRQMRAALRPGGRFYTWDPLAYNPAIAVYRRMATRVRSTDERPLTFADVALARSHFDDVGHREFWIASLALFLKFYLVDRVHPNQDRYWKRIYRQTPAALWWWRPLAAADHALTRLPLVRRLAWNMVMWGTRATDAPGGRR